MNKLNEITYSLLLYHIYFKKLGGIHVDHVDVYKLCTDIRIFYFSFNFTFTIKSS